MDKDLARRQVAERAAEWVLRLQNAGPAEQLAFWQWLNESPLHIREFLAAQATETVLTHYLSHHKQPLAESIEDPPNVVCIY